MRRAFLRPVAHGDSNCTVEFDDRQWLDMKQPVVEQGDLPQVRGAGKEASA
jgi:hypothetical protein